MDFQTMDASGSGAVPAGTPIAVIDFVEPTQTASTSSAGCEDADFPASLAGKVAVIQRGTCDFGLKARKAQTRSPRGRASTTTAPARRRRSSSRCRSTTCYHLACDSYGIRKHPDNINDTALDINSDAVAHSVMTFAMTESSTNGTDKASTGTTGTGFEFKGSHRRR